MHLVSYLIPEPKGTKIVKPWCRWFGNIKIHESVEIINKMHLVVEFIITPFIEGSTCLERHTAHRQEL
jgi:hypothetical protein